MWGHLKQTYFCLALYDWGTTGLWSHYTPILPGVPDSGVSIHPYYLGHHTMGVAIHTYYLRRRTQESLYTYITWGTGLWSRYTPILPGAPDSGVAPAAFPGPPAICTCPDDSLTTASTCPWRIGSAQVSHHHHQRAPSPSVPQGLQNPRIPRPAITTVKYHTNTHKTITTVKYHTNTHKTSYIS
jgi:hypothetical protein